MTPRPLFARFIVIFAMLLALIVAVCGGSIYVAVQKAVQARDEKDETEQHPRGGRCVARDRSGRGDVRVRLGKGRDLHGCGSLRSEVSGRCFTRATNEAEPDRHAAVDFSSADKMGLPLGSRSDGLAW